MLPFEARAGSRRTTSAVAFAATLASSAACTCSGTSLGGSTAGALDRGVFVYTCVEQTDPACSDGEDRPLWFPNQVALGSTFDLRFRARDDQLLTSLWSASSNVMPSADEGWIAREAGWAAMVAYKLFSEKVVDFTHLEVVEPTLVITSRPDRPLLVGEDAVLQVLAEDPATGEALAGTLPYEWELTTGDAVVDWTEEGAREWWAEGFSADRARVEVVALRAGTATVSVSDGVRTAQLRIEVLADPDPGTAATADTGAPSRPHTGRPGPATADTADSALVTR